MNTKTKIITLALFAVTAGAFSLQRMTDVPPSDLRDAVGEETAAEQLLKGPGAASHDAAAIPTVTPSPVPEKDIVFPAKQLFVPSPAQMEKLIGLARYLHEHSQSGISKGTIMTHRFEVAGTNLPDGSFQLRHINLIRIQNKLLFDFAYYRFTVDPDGAVGKNVDIAFDNKVEKFLSAGGSKLTTPWSVDFPEFQKMLAEEVSFWVDYETKREAKDPGPALPAKTRLDPRNIEKLKSLAEFARKSSEWRQLLCVEPGEEPPVFHRLRPEWTSGPADGQLRQITLFNRDYYLTSRGVQTEFIIYPDGSFVDNSGTKGMLTGEVSFWLGLKDPKACLPGDNPEDGYFDENKVMWYEW